MSPLFNKDRRSDKDRRSGKDPRQSKNSQYRGYERRVVTEGRVEGDRRRIQLMMPEI